MIGLYCQARQRTALQQVAMFTNMQALQLDPRRTFTCRPSLRHHDLSVARWCQPASSSQAVVNSRECVSCVDGRALSSSSSIQESASRRQSLAILLSATAACLLPEHCRAAEATLDRAQQVATAIEQDFVDRQYYITGNLSKDLYNPKCRFTDPTTDVKGVEPYTKAVALLFDSATSKAELIRIQVLSPTSIKLRWRLEGALRLGGLKFKPYTGTTIYTLNPDTGLIDTHYETWDIGAADVFFSTLFPNAGAPPAPPIEVLRSQELGAA